MTAIVSVVLSYAAFVSGAPGAGTVVNVCTPHGGACEVRAPADEPPTYATPVEVDCRAVAESTGTVGRTELPLFSGDCGFPRFDFRYRVSRVPDSERPTGSWRPQRTRRTARTIATTSGLPSDPDGLISSTGGQPLAMYALMSLTRPTSRQVEHVSNRRAPNRIVEPLERPPRRA